MEYQAIIKFNYSNCTQEQKEKYFSVLDKYRTFSFENSNYSKGVTSTLIITTNQELSKKALASDLGDLEVISFKLTRN